jgi:hypothetical protein
LWLLPGEAGELGIYPRHTPLITRIKRVRCAFEKADGSEEFVFVAGGILEVQPNCVTVMSDTAIRGKDLDDEKANGHDGGPVVGVAKVPRQQVSERLSCRARHFLRSKSPVRQAGAFVFGGMVERSAGRGWAHRAQGFTKLPDFPPCFSRTRTSVMVMPRSTALHMS